MAGCSSADAQRRTQGVRLRGIAAAIMLAGAVTLAGCSSEPEFEWPEDPVPEPTPTVDAAEADATDELLALVDGYRRAEITAQADPEPAYQAQDRFTEYLADPLLSSVLFELEILHQRGLVREGEPSWDPTVTELRLDDTPPTATIRDCLDATDWRLAHRGNGEPAGADGLPARYAPDRHVVEFTAKLFDQGWLLEDARMEGDGQC